MLLRTSLFVAAAVTLSAQLVCASPRDLSRDEIEQAVEWVEQRRTNIRRGATALLEQLEADLHRARVGRIGPGPRGSNTMYFESRQARADKVREIEQDIAFYREVLASVEETAWVPSMDLSVGPSSLRTGMIGVIVTSSRGGRGKEAGPALQVVQILGDGKAIVRANWSKENYIIDGLPHELVDEEYITPKGVYRVKGPTTFTTVGGGSRTLYELEEIAWPPLPRAEADGHERP